MGLCLFIGPRSWAEDRPLPSNKNPIRSVALRPIADASADMVAFQNTPESLAKNTTLNPEVAIVQEVNRQRYQFSPYFYVEGEYSSYRGLASRNQWVTLDKPEVYAVYHVLPYDVVTPYFRMGADWLREENFNYSSNTSTQNDVIGLHMGGGVRVGFARHLALDFDLKYLISTMNNKKTNTSDSSWGGSIGALLYF